MNQKRAIELCTENLALKLSQAMPCEQPDRSSLDNAISEKIVARYPEENPSLYSSWPDTFDSNAFEQTYGKAVWNNLLPKCTHAIRNRFSSTFFAVGNPVIRSAVRHFAVRDLAQLFFNHFGSERSGAERAKLDWEFAAALLDTDPHILRQIERDVLLLSLYKFQTFHAQSGAFIWDYAYKPLLTGHSIIPLSNAYTSLKRCTKHFYGCVCADAKYVKM